MKQHVYSRELNGAAKYEVTFKTHINPVIGRQFAEQLSREQVRGLMEAARVKRKRPKGEHGGPYGGVEAARTMSSPSPRASFVRRLMGNVPVVAIHRKIKELESRCPDYNP
ncbi:MAG TPA: hypothetical protein VGV09_17940 [Steroidobacteraceae bacterium]|nr:hypothetical protein [Steroidobacteraceae bacterium]